MHIGFEECDGRDFGGKSCKSWKSRYKRLPHIIFQKILMTKRIKYIYIYIFVLLIKKSTIGNYLNYFSFIYSMTGVLQCTPKCTISYHRCRFKPERQYLHLWKYYLVKPCPHLFSHNSGQDRGRSWLPIQYLTLFIDTNMG